MVLAVRNTSLRNNVPKFLRQRKQRIVSRASSKEPRYLEFAELVNSRCAMQGFIWGSVREALTGNTILEQVVAKSDTGAIDINPEGILLYSTIVGLVSLGTAFTYFNNDANTSFKQFTSEAELVNGRTAMIGFALLLGLGLGNFP